MPVRYYFLLHNPDGSLVEDFGGDRKLDLAFLGRGHTVILDSWNDLGAIENVYFTEPFQDVLLKMENDAVSVMTPASATHSFSVKAPLLPKGQTICLLGTARVMGDWNQAAPVLLRRCAENGYFDVKLDLAGESFPITYKYGVYDSAKKAFLRHEDGANRVVDGSGFAG